MCPQPTPQRSCSMRECSTPITPSCILQPMPSCLCPILSSPCPGTTLLLPWCLRTSTWACRPCSLVTCGFEHALRVFESFTCARPAVSSATLSFCKYPGHLWGVKSILLPGPSCFAHDKGFISSNRLRLNRPNCFCLSSYLQVPPFFPCLPSWRLHVLDTESFRFAFLAATRQVNQRSVPIL